MPRVHVKLVSPVAFNSLVTSQPLREASYARLGFKSAAGCGWDHPGIWVSLIVAQPAPRPGSWGRNVRSHFTSNSGSEPTSGSGCKAA